MNNFINEARRIKVIENWYLLNDKSKLDHYSKKIRKKKQTGKEMYNLSKNCIK